MRGALHCFCPWAPKTLVTPLQHRIMQAWAFNIVIFVVHKTVAVMHM